MTNEAKIKTIDKKASDIRKGVEYAKWLMLVICARRYQAENAVKERAEK